MSDLLFIPSTLLYLLVVGLLFIFGANFLYLTAVALRKRHPQVPPPPPLSWPAVTIQLPIYNEMYVVERLIRAAVSLDYPRELLEVQVLDDSTDETVALVETLVHQLRDQGYHIHHLHRTIRSGYKAGALAAGLASAEGEFLAIFDADFLPPPDFLRRTLPYFQDARIGFLQTRWGHVNSSYSLLTRMQSLAIDAHFVVEQYARYQGGFWFNFNGTAGIWRRAALEDAGGWRADTLTEDLDLSYRSFLKGWRGLYLRDVEVPSEIPVTFSAYRRQQQRWARGSLECAIKYIPEVWNTSIPISHKIEATLHLLGYSIHLLMFCLAILFPVVLYLSQHYTDLSVLFGLVFMFNLTGLAPIIYITIAQQQLRNRWWLALPQILIMSLLGAGMMLNTVRAALQILFDKKAVFERTPKFGIIRQGQNWTRHQYQIKLDPIVIFEIGFALFNLVTLLFSVRMRDWTLTFYAALFCCGLFFTSSMTILQSIHLRQERAEAPAQIAYTK
jgi:cellulose synthase/poly-beta-1,6-N-acetylglucosamine synthase-like glycosyltransferase